jgi:hypothetical protein
MGGERRGLRAVVARCIGRPRPARSERATDVLVRTARTRVHVPAADRLADPLTLHGHTHHAGDRENPEPCRYRGVRGRTGSPTLRCSSRSKGRHQFLTEMRVRGT